MEPPKSLSVLDTNPQSSSDAHQSKIPLFIVLESYLTFWYSERSPKISFEFLFIGLSAFPNKEIDWVAYFENTLANPSSISRSSK